MAVCNIACYYTCCLIVLFLHCPMMTESSKILLTGVQMRSHMFDQLALAEELVLRGHDVYYAVASRWETITNIEKKGIKVLTYHMPPDVTYYGSDDIEQYTKSIIFESADADDRMRREASILGELVARDCNFMMGDQGFLNTVRGVHFDIVIAEPFLFNPCTMVLPKHLGIPFITMSSMFIPWDIRIPALPSFYPLLLTGDTTNSLSLKDRLVSLRMYLIMEFNLLLKQDTGPLTRYTEGYTSYNELLRESELFIVVTDHLLDRIAPVMPNYVRLPGISSRPSKPLPDDLEQLMTSAKEGVVVMTFGSLVTHMPEDIIKKFLDAFGQLNQTVIAKLCVTEGLTIPPNVHIRASLLPQNDILGHPNTRLFITHCGNGGQYEAVYHGVPMLGFPLFGEQASNAQRAIEKGFGLALNIHDFTSPQLFDNIQEILTNPKYTVSIRKMSAVMHSEPMNPRQKASFWIEHVIKHGGKHLRSVAMDMPTYQFLMFDIIALVFGILLSFLILLTLIIVCIVRKMCSRSSIKSDKTKKRR